MNTDFVKRQDVESNTVGVNINSKGANCTRIKRFALSKRVNDMKID